MEESIFVENLEEQQRIELIQAFEMPMLSSSISMTRDGQYIFVTGSYKPRVRCYDVNELSLKFERCFDYECIQMKILSEDYSKVKFEFDETNIDNLVNV